MGLFTVSDALTWPPPGDGKGLVGTYRHLDVEDLGKLVPRADAWLPGPLFESGDC